MQLKKIKIFKRKFINVLRFFGDSPLRGQSPHRQKHLESGRVKHSATSDSFEVNDLLLLQGQSFTFLQGQSRSAGQSLTFRGQSLLIILLFLFSSCTAFAESMDSPNYKLEWTNLNMTSGKKTSPGTGNIVTDTVGQTAAGKYSSSGYIVRAGFQYIYSIIPFTFSLSKITVNLGTLTPNTFSTQSETLTVSVGGAFGYSVSAVEDDQLRKSTSVYIPDTECDSALDPCTVTDAKVWISTTRYGFGYNMSGTDIPATFVDSTYFRPFPSKTDGGSPAVVMSGTNVGKDIQSTITYKVNISNTQEAGSYQNIINFVATPSY